ncbi:MAG: UDP-N-acetylenolpyruvoylglucosamine reductase [Candidatus Shapirobacteria bacterium GW2011_GWF1_38_23]|nr:MAG: UDP-N-acetylenolpyruvoylglucosamine reductase [Candidatus Shapirobacteria bacterium GW2011_GWF1_38_23]
MLPSPNNQVKVDSGVNLPLLITDTINHSLSGLEEFAYIPSSIGGAIFGNIHGINKNNFDRFLTEIQVFDLEQSKTYSLKSNILKWSYDTSEFATKPNLIILSAIFQLTPGDADTSRQKVIDIITKKLQTQSMNSLGSVFKNLPARTGHPADFAGRIIDQELNLKGFQIGDAQISPLHGNFILNLGHATAADYYAVVKKIQSEAKSKLNITLEPEIKFLGNFS